MSSITNRLIFVLGDLSQCELKQMKPDASRPGKISIAFAYCMDGKKEESTPEITIACATKEFYSDPVSRTIRECEVMGVYVCIAAIQSTLLAD